MICAHTHKYAQVLLPPILGMDVATELVPTMRFLNNAGLSVFDMARFPQVPSAP